MGSPELGGGRQDSAEPGSLGLVAGGAGRGPCSTEPQSARPALTLAVTAGHTAATRRCCWGAASMAGRTGARRAMQRTREQGHELRPRGSPACSPRKPARADRENREKLPSAGQGAQGTVCRVRRVQAWRRALTFGDSTLISSFRKRNLATSPWNLPPQWFTHVSSTCRRGGPLAPGSPGTASTGWNQAGVPLGPWGH